MEEVNEEVYSTIFNALRHGVRRNILRMLNEQELSFTKMEEALSLSSSHLTYHLDALKELISKTDQGYRLSVFGKAAVEMIEKVEDPPMEIKKWNLKFMQFSIALLVITILISGLFGYAQVQLNEMRNIQTEHFTQITDLTGKLEPYESLKEQLQTRPQTHFSQGVVAVTGWSIRYKHDYTMDMPYDENKYSPYFYAFFYSPDDDLTLYLEPGKNLTPVEFAYPLTVQKGNAWWNQSGVKIVETFPDGFTQVKWQSPIIWQENITSTDVMEIQLQEKGWYTLCMTGSVSVSQTGGVSMKIGVAGPEETRINYADTWIDFKLHNKGEEVIFCIWSRE